MECCKTVNCITNNVVGRAIMTNEIIGDNYAVSLQRAVTIRTAYNGNRIDTDLINNPVAKRSEFRRKSFAIERA